VSTTSTGRVVSVNQSERKTMRKQPGTRGTLVLDRGFDGDAHAGDWHRQVSLLALESIEKMRAAGLDVGPGDFAENITTEGLDLMVLPVGTVIRIGDDVLIEMSQIGKVCHTKCAIYYQAGDCVMPREGIFAVVRQAGDVAVGDAIEVVSLGDGTCDRTPPEAIAEFEAEKAREAMEAASRAEAASGSGSACAPASARTRAKKE
jgi:MOSC domain-containing protein YiiM